MATLQLASDTLAGTPTAGQVEYNGQYYATDSNASRGQIERLVQGTAQASTSGTSIDFTGIPSWAKRITVMLSGVSVSGTSSPLVQIGSGSVSSSGYLSYATITDSSSAQTSSTAGFIIFSNTAAANIYGTMILTLISGNTWLASGSVSMGITVIRTSTFGGNNVLSGTLDRVRITTVNGTDTFDAGSINIMYEG